MTGASLLPEGGRHHGEVTMEAFIKNQMMIILQPFVEHVQQLDARLAQFQEHLDHGDAQVASLRNALGDTNTNVLDLQGGLKKTEVVLQTLKENLDRAAEDHEMLHRSVEHSNGWLQRVHNQAESAASEMPELRRIVGEAECQLQGLRANLQRTNDCIGHDVKVTLDRLSTDLQETKVGLGETRSDLSQLKDDHARKSQHLQETRALLDKNCVASSNLQRSSEAQMARDAELGRHQESVKAQVTKMQSVVEGLHKDAAFLKQKQEYHDSTVHTLQQNHAAMYTGQETMQDSHDKLSREVHALEQGIKSVRDSLDDARNALNRTNGFTNSLHSGLDKACTDLQATCQRLDGLENRHASLTDGVDKTNGRLTELAMDHRRSVSDVEDLRHELSKSNEVLSSARNQLDSTNDRLAGLSGELGQTNEAVRKLDSGMELCQAGFTGLQKGFVETGAHIASRPLTLPKLSREDRLAKHALKDGHKAPLTARGPLGGALVGVGTEMVGSPWARPSEDLESTHMSQYSSRRSTLLSDC